MFKKLLIYCIQVLTYDCQTATQEICLNDEISFSRWRKTKLRLHKLFCPECQQFYQNNQKMHLMIQEHKNYQNTTK